MKPPLVSDKTFRAYLTGRGVPIGALLAPFPRNYMDLISRIPRPDDNRRKSISQQKQAAMLKRSLEAPTDGNWFMCIGGQQSDNLPLQVALHLFCKAFAKSNAQTGRPYWHVITGAPQDALRDDPSTLASMGGSLSMLVVSNVAVNSTAMKLEKVRDILAQHSHVPRILVIAGDNPIEFCHNKLFVSPSRVAYFGGKDEE